MLKKAVFVIGNKSEIDEFPNEVKNNITNVDKFDDCYHVEALIDGENSVILEFETQVCQIINL